MRISILVLAAMCIVSQAGAQDAKIDTRGAVKQGQFIVQTVPLHHLSSTDAVKLLEPYVQTPGGGVFGVSNVRAVTIKEVQETFMQIRQVLERYDRDPASLTLNFQLIAADNGGKRDNSVSGLDSLLRNVLKFSGYHLLGTAVVNVMERNSAQQTLSADGQDYKLYYEVQDVTLDASGAGSVQLRVSLQKTGTYVVSGSPMHDPILLSTGVTIPIGNTVVLGTAVESARPAVMGGAQGGARGSSSPLYVIDGVVQPQEGARDKALILTVRPQLTSRRDGKSPD
jgi:hypothetical protein